MESFLEYNAIVYLLSLYYREKYCYRWHDEFSSEQADGWKYTIGKQRQGGEGVDSSVYICKALKKL